MNVVHGEFKNHTLCKMRKECGTQNPLSSGCRLLIGCFQNRNAGGQGVDVGRDADLAPGLCIGCTRRLGLASVLNGVTAYQKMCRQTITGS
jgi:hypothetical protein